MSVDPWSWGDDNSDQDWNNGWSNQDRQQNITSVSGFGNAPPSFGSNNNPQQSMDNHGQHGSYQNNQRSSGWPHQTPQTNSTADYFSYKPPLNNNPFPDVENKEIAPPDHHTHHIAGHKQPMKLGSKQPHLEHSAMKNTQEEISAHFDNTQHSSTLHQEQHSSLQQQHSSLQQQQSSEYLQHDMQHNSPRNQANNYFSNSNHSQTGNTWSYFSYPDWNHSASPHEPQSLPLNRPDGPVQQIPFDHSAQQFMPYNQSNPLTSHQPQSLPPNQVIGPPQHASIHPQSLSQKQGSGPLQPAPQSFPVTQSVAPPFQSTIQPPPAATPNSTLQDRQSQNEPKNFSYFHTQDSQLADRDLSHSKPPSNQESLLTYCIEEPVDGHQSSSACPETTSQLPQNFHQNLENNSISHKSHNRDEPHVSQVSNDLSSRQLSDNPVPSNETIDQRPPKPFTEKLPSSHSPDANNRYPPEIPKHQIPVNEERMSIQGQESSGPQGFIEPERPRSREFSGEPTAADSDRLGSQGLDRSLPPHPQGRLEPERAGSQGREWPGAQPKRPMERPPSQGKESSVSQGSERFERMPPSSQAERPSSRDWPKSQTDRPILQGQDRSNSFQPQQTDRPNSQGRDWPPQPPQHSDNSISQGRKWSGTQLSDRSGSLGRDWPGIDRSGSQEKMSHHRTPSQGSDRSGSIGRGSGPRTERSDLVASRSPGAGEDRTSPPARPDNMESLPPDPDISHQMNQLSLQPKSNSDKMDDCPLDRNEYLETSQLSNQETTNNETRLSRHQPSEFSRSSHRGERREVVGEAEPLAGRVVLGHTTPTTTPPPNHSDEVEGGGSGSMERMVVGERREQSSRNNRSSRQRNHHRRESSFEEDDQDYSSDNRRVHRDEYSRREERHRKKRGQDHRSMEYMSDEEYEIDRRVYSRRDRRGRERDYSPEYRRDYYRDDMRRGGRGGRDYYRYDDDDYSYRERSRPSSRSGSDYRRTNLEYNSRNQSRHNYFNSSLATMFGGREYETNPEYFETLRKTDPMLYAVWYQLYMRKLQDTAAHSAFTQSDRASIHSGQSSGNRIHVSTPNQGLDSNIGAVDSFEDYSPRLFSTPHVRGSYDGQGRLVVVNACNPLDGQTASVQLLSVESDYQDQEDVEEFLEFPGPFIPGVTHRSSVLQYLRKMSDQSEKNSEKLLYDLVHLIVKSNGKPDASDLSELLLESYRNSRGDCKDQWDPDPSVPQPISHQDMLSKFRNLLHQGNKQEALDWAMKHGGWGHALFLASKMDTRTQNRVAGEFARSLAPCDPLSTLYQVLSGGVPAAATACSDNRWADWRPHLAMVLSNLTDRSAVDLTTITTLADGLVSRGRVHAAHSCHIIAQVMFGDLYRNEGPVLLGWIDTSQPSTIAQSHISVTSFCYRSFLLTLCYEYAMKQGQPNFYIPALQKYKLLMAWRLIEWGRGREALLYCELLGSELLQSISDSNLLPQHADLVHLIVDLSSSLKALDPLAPAAATDLFMTPDSDWLQRLKQYATTLPVEESEPQVSNMSQPESLKYSSFEPHPHVPLYHTGGGVNGGFGGQIRVDDPPILSAPEPVEPPVQVPPVAKPVPDFHPPTQPLSHQMPPIQNQMQPPLQQPSSMPPVSAPLTFQPNFVSQPSSFTGYDDGGSTEVDHAVDAGSVIKPSLWEPEHQPESSSQPMVKPSTNYFHTSENLLQGMGDSGKTAKSSQPAVGSESKKNPDALGGNNGNGGSGSWFGGIIEKLSRKPKNQMVLPDDKDPKIVFDPKLKRWIDRDSEDGDTTQKLKPPPMMNQALPHGNGNIPAGNPPIPSVNPSVPFGSAPPQANSTNKYKLQKGKSMRSNYVDLLSSSGSSSKVSGNMEPMVPSMVPHSDAVNSNFVVPQPGGNTESSGSQMPSESHFQGQMPAHAVPTFYNPANYKS